MFKGEISLEVVEKEVNIVSPLSWQQTGCLGLSLCVQTYLSRPIVPKSGDTRAPIVTWQIHLEKNLILKYLLFGSA